MSVEIVDNKMTKGGSILLRLHARSSPRVRTIQFIAKTYVYSAGYHLLSSILIPAFFFYHTLNNRKKRAAGVDEWKEEREKELRRRDCLRGLRHGRESSIQTCLVSRW